MKFRVMYLIDDDDSVYVAQRAARSVVIEAENKAAAEAWGLKHRAIVWAELLDCGSFGADADEITVSVMSLDDWCALEMQRAQQMVDRYAERMTYCQNCGKHWHHEKLEEVDDLDERVAPGEPMPAGECPSCGALCQPCDAEKYEGTTNG